MQAIKGYTQGCSFGGKKGGGFRNPQLKNSTTLEALKGYTQGCAFGGCKGRGFIQKYNNRYTKEGELRDYTDEYHRNIMKQLPNVKTVELCSVNYLNLNVPNNSVIYCDPPYRGVSKYKGQQIDYDEFDKWCNEQKNNGNTVFVSEYLGALPEEKLIWSKVVTCTMRSNEFNGLKKIEALYKI